MKLDSNPNQPLRKSSKDDDEESNDNKNHKKTDDRLSRFALASLFFLMATSISWIIAMAFTDFVEKSFKMLGSEKKQHLWRGLYALTTFVGGFIILYGLSLIVFNNQPWALKAPQLFSGFF
jgi:hypothetical protein